MELERGRRHRVVLLSKSVAALSVGALTIGTVAIAGASTKATGTIAIASTSIPAGTQGIPYSDQLSATETGVIRPANWSITAGVLPKGLSFHSNGLISGTPKANGIQNLIFQVKEAGTTIVASAKLSITINPAPATPPGKGNVVLAGAVIGTPYAAGLTATGGTAPLHWSLTAGKLPLGLHLASNTGVISGLARKVGTSIFSAQVTDHNGATASDTYSITVTSPTAGPVISTTALADGTVAATYNQQLEISGGKAPYKWTVVQGQLPLGLHLVEGTGQIVGRPSHVEAQTFTVKATDHESQFTEAELSITVVAPPAPSIITTSLPTATQGSTYDSVLVATGGTGVDHFSVTAGTLPAGLFLISNSGQIVGVPQVVGSSLVTFTVTDAAGQSASVQLSLVVQSEVGPSASDQSLGSVSTGTVINQQLVATGGTPQLTFDLAAGSKLPDGISLFESGVIAGAPTAIGPASFTVVVTDHYGQSATFAVTLTVTAPPAS